MRTILIFLFTLSSVHSFFHVNLKKLDRKTFTPKISDRSGLFATSSTNDDDGTSPRRSFFKQALSGALLTGIVGNKIAIEGPAPYTPPMGLLDGKVIVITGGNTGLGLETAKRLAAGGATVVLTSRNPVKGAKAVQAVEDYEPSSKGKVFSLSLDLCDLADVKAFPNKYRDLLGERKIDVLVNNAGVMAVPEFETSKDGFEKTFATNHLGHFALTALLFPSLNKGGRIVNVSSMAHLIVADGLDMDNLNAEKGYKPWDAYGRSKLENVLFTKELQNRIDKAGLSLTAVTLHPGVVRTDLARYLVGEDTYVPMDEQKNAKLSLDPKTLALLPLVYFTKAVDRGATSQVWLSSFQGSDVGGKFFQNCKEVKLGTAACDLDKAKQLWDVSSKLTGVDFNI
mmetsp:Transcript_8500/g.10905  ORF Transcript_8500/g.10905 Transcript_8500/m.10905 type:complete len:397 (-) Transcript_8500:32-1222(-)